MLILTDHIAPAPETYAVDAQYLLASLISAGLSHGWADPIDDFALAGGEISKSEILARTETNCIPSGYPVPEFEGRTGRFAWQVFPEQFGVVASAYVTVNRTEGECIRVEFDLSRLSPRWTLTISVRQGETGQAPAFTRHTEAAEKWLFSVIHAARKCGVVAANKSGHPIEGISIEPDLGSEKAALSQAIRRLCAQFGEDTVAEIAADVRTEA